MAYHELAKLIELDEGFRRTVNVSGRRLLLIHNAGTTTIIEDRCPHMDALLSTGDIANGEIRCRAHGIAFSLLNGAATGPLKDTLPCLTLFPLVYNGKGVGVDL